jgi:glycosyltransferase involved in cell wall biosynthesis
LARVLQVCNTAFYLDRFLAPLVRAIRESGHHVDVVCEGEPVTRGKLGDGVEVFPFTYPREMSPLQFARAIRAMRKIVRRGRYDCVASHNRNASIVGRSTAFLERVPVNLYTAHGFYFHDDQGRAAHTATLGLETALARITDFTLSQSEEDMKMMVARGFIRADRIQHIGNGIDTRRFFPRREERVSLESDLGLRSNVFRVAATGRLVRGKGFSDLLVAFAAFHRRHPASQLVIIGGNIDQDLDAYAAELMEESKRLGLTTEGTTPSFVVTGLTNRVPDYLATADVFVIPSYREGLPRALIEAMSAELAVIATDIRGCREAVVHEDSGFLYAPHDTTRLEARLEELFASPELRTRLATRARKRAIEHFDERDYVQRQVDAIHRLVGRPA